MIRHADLVGLVLPERLLGTSYLDRLCDALPELDGADLDHLVLTEAPFLRWVIVVGGGKKVVRHASAIEDVMALADQPRFGDGLLKAIESEVRSDEPAIMILTSGSTSDPKGVPHSHAALLAEARFLAEQLRFGPGTKSFIDLPYFWVGGLMLSLFPALVVGGTAYSSEGFDSGEFLDIVEREQIDRVYLSVRHQIDVASDPDLRRRDLSCVRIGPEVLTGRPWSLETEPSATPTGRIMGLGMSETLGPYWWGEPGPELLEAASGMPTVNASQPSRFAPPPLDESEFPPYFELEVRDDMGVAVGPGQKGEICIRGATVTRGLHKIPRHQSFHPDGFYRTGDSAQLDSSGRARFTGRIGDMIKSSGANVAPAEVVGALLTVAGVKQALVVGLPDPGRGALVAAAVVLEEGVNLEADDLRRQVAQDLSTYKVPSVVVFIDEEEVPWTGSGKFNRPALVDLIRRKSKPELVS